MKPGYKTTEFWIALASGLVATLGAAYGLTATQQQELSQQLGVVITSVGTLAAFATVAFKYIHDRTALKLNEQDAEVVKSLPTAEVADEDDDDPADAWKKN